LVAAIPGWLLVPGVLASPFGRPAQRSIVTQVPQSQA
jgi:hypothetical protein